MNYERELEFAKELAYESGDVMRRYFRAEDIGLIEKDDKTPLTVADTKINSMVIERVKNMFPKDGVIGEEESYETDRDRVWVVDPIDGTAPFSLGMPLSTFMIALVNKSDGQPVVSVVYDPYLEHMYSAVLGKGARLNDRTLQVTSRNAFPARYVAVYGQKCDKGGVSYDPDAVMSVLRERHFRNFTFSSGGYVMVKVADGTFSAFIAGKPAKSWDMAAPALIVREAGGIVTDLDGKERRYDEAGFGCVMAVNEATHKELLKLIKEKV
jgi:fructose-1,6-bisphosphatase/inositol monophosphatase family enzyme